MATTQEMVIRLAAKTESAERNLKNLGNTVSGLDQKNRGLRVSWTELNQGLELARKGFNAVAGVTRQLFSALDRAQVVEGVAKGFETLQRQAGLLAGDSLVALREATQGMVTDFELMQSANQAVQLGLDPSKLADMAEAATRLGAAVGRTANESFRDLITGVGRASPLILDNLGITIKAAEAQQRYATELGKTVAQLTETEKAEAFRFAALEKIAEKAKELGEVQLNAGQSATIARVAFSNLTDEFVRQLNENEALAQAFQEVARVLSEIDIAAFALQVGEATEAILEQVKALAKWIDTASLAGATTADFTKIISKNNQTMVNSAKTIEQAEANVDAWALQMLIAEKELKKIGNTAGITSRAYEAQKAVVKANIDLWEKGTRRLDILRRQQEINTKETKEQTTQTKELSKEQKELIKTIEGLEKKYINLQRSIELESLKESLEDAIRAGNTADFEQIRERMEQNIYQGILDGIDEANQNNPKIKELALNVSKTMAGAVVKESETTIHDAIRDETKEAFQESVSFWEDILIGAVEGNIKDVLENMLTRAAIKFGAELLAQATANFAGLHSIGLLGSGTTGTTTGQGASGILGGFGLGSLLGGGGFGAGAGSSFANGTFGGISLGGVIGGGALAYYGANAANNYAQGDRLNYAEAAALAIPTFGASFLGTQFNPFGGGGDPLEQIRREIRDMISEMLGGSTFSTVGGTSPDIFGIDFAQVQQDLNATNPLLQEAVGLTQGLAQIITGGGENAEAFNAIFGEAIQADASNYNELLLNAGSLLDSMGVTAEQATQGLSQLFLQGKISLEEFETGIRGFRQIANADFGDVHETLQLFIDTLDTQPALALKAFEGVINEMKELGISDFGEMASFVSDRWGPEVAGAFEELKQRGIGSISDLNFESADHLAALFRAFESFRTDAIGEMERVGTEGTSAIKDPLQEFSNTFLGVDLPASFGKAAAKAGNAWKNNSGKLLQGIKDVREAAEEAADAVEEIGSGGPPKAPRLKRLNTNIP